jgi:hypothetical protein
MGQDSLPGTILARCGQVWPSVAKCGQVWPEIPYDTTRQGRLVVTESVAEVPARG